MVGVASVIVLSAFSGGYWAPSTPPSRRSPTTITVTARVHRAGRPAGQPLTDDDVAALASIPQVASIIPPVTGATTARRSGAQPCCRKPHRKYLSANVIGTTAIGEDQQPELWPGRVLHRTPTRVRGPGRGAGPRRPTALSAWTERGDRANRADQASNLPHHRIVEGLCLPTDASIVMPETAAPRAVFGYGYAVTNSAPLVMVTSTADVSIAKKNQSRLGHKHRIRDPRFLDFQIQDIGRGWTYQGSSPAAHPVHPARRGDLAACRWHRGAQHDAHLGHRPDAGNRIRKAIGASDSAVLVQFALEAIVVAGLGGLIGVRRGHRIGHDGLHGNTLVGPTGS